MSNHDRKGPDSPDRDATLEQAWRQVSHEQPPSRLDAAIIAAAHEAVGNRVARPQIVHVRSRWWLTQWQPVAAAAAVTGLAFVLVQMLPRERGVAPSMQIEAPAVDAEQQVHRGPPVRSEALDTSAPAKPAAGAAMERDMMDVPAPAAAPPATVGRQSVDSVNRNEVVAERATEAAAAEVDRRDASPPGGFTGAAAAVMAAPASAAKQGTAASVSAADWAARVAALYESGDTAQAADALRAFRAAYADADNYLSESLHDWARTVE